jgi:hypothetical protein
VPFRRLRRVIQIFSSRETERASAVSRKSAAGFASAEMLRFLLISVARSRPAKIKTSTKIKSQTRQAYRGDQRRKKQRRMARFVPSFFLPSLFCIACVLRRFSKAARQSFDGSSACKEPCGQSDCGLLRCAIFPYRQLFLPARCGAKTKARRQAAEMFKLIESRIVRQICPESGALLSIIERQPGIIGRRL